MAKTRSRAGFTQRRTTTGAFACAAAALPLALGAGSASLSAQGNVDLPRYPSISPDGSMIVFSWRGDLWRVSSEGGDAVRLTTHPGDDLITAWSADGERIAFASNREGSHNLYLMDVNGANVRPVTQIDRSLGLNAFGVDENGDEVLTLTASLEGDVFRSTRPYMVSTDGGEIRRAHDAFGRSPVVSPDGRRVAFVRRDSSWNRRHYRGPDNRDVWIYDRDTGEFTQLTTWEGNDGQPRWIDDEAIAFLSDREFNVVNLYRMDIDTGERSARRLTSFDTDDVVAFDVAADGRTAALHVWDTLYTLDLARRGQEPQALTIYASEDERDNYELKAIDREVTESALSPDGQVMAYIAYGEVYVRNIEEKSATRRVTSTHARERSVAWSPDGLKLFFVSDRDGTESIYAATVAVTRGEIKEEFEKALGLKKDEEKESDDDDADSDDQTDGNAGDNGNANAAAPSSGAANSKGAAQAGADEPHDADDPAAAADPVTGDWAGSATLPDGSQVPFTMTLTLAASGDVTGSLESGLYSGPLTGTFDTQSGQLSLTLTASDVTFDLTVTEDGTLSGTASAGETTAEIAANRSTPPPDPDANGAAAAPPATSPEDEDEAKKDDDAEDDDIPKEFDPARWHDAMKFNIENVIVAPSNDRDPRPSPDGKSLAFRRGRGDVAIFDFETGEIRTVVNGWDTGIDWRWSPDSRYLAYHQDDLNFNTDIWIVRADGSEPAVNITRHPDNDYAPRWSADGKILSFVSERVNEEYDLWMVYLEKDLEALTDKELTDYYEAAAKEAKERKPLKVELPEWAKPDEDDDGDVDESDGEGAGAAAHATDDGESGENGNEGDGDPDDVNSADDEEPTGADEPDENQLDLDDAYLRLRRVTRHMGSESNNEMTPAGDHYIYTAGGDNSGLYSVKWDGSEEKRISGNVSVQALNLTGDSIVFVSGGRGGVVKVAGGSPEYYDIDDQMRIDLQEQSSQKFIEAARTLGERFYHPTMKDLEWDRLSEKYHGLALAARTGDEFNHVAARFIGELNASHLGVYASEFDSPNSQSCGRLGVDWRRVDHGFEITHVVPESPADQGPMRLVVGDIITSIDLEGCGPLDTLESCLTGRVGKETILTVRRMSDAGEVIDLNILMTPTSYGRETELRYEEWRNRNAALVEEWSNGRIGYIHIEGMNQPSLDVFERDLYAAAHDKDALIIDVRNNGGGWTTDRLLASICYPRHAYTIPRGADEAATTGYPQDRLFIQGYTLPIDMLCNEKSFSNAEIISHAFKTIGRGKLVGQETYGGVISTGGTSLIDGTFMRLPFRGWYLPDGTDMENHGAVPDIIVDQTPEAESRDDDEQLRAAVDDLLARVVKNE